MTDDGSAGRADYAQFQRSLIRAEAERFFAALPVTQGDPVAISSALIDRWSEPHREAFGLVHLQQVLKMADHLAPYSSDPTAVRLAVFYHDAVRSGASSDQENSALLAISDLGRLGLADTLVEEVARLVRLTATHDPAPGDTNGATLCDADLAVLATPPDSYFGYVASLRAEFPQISTAAFDADRANKLTQLLARPSLFRTPMPLEHWEPIARANLAAELEQLLTGARPTALLAARWRELVGAHSSAGDLDATGARLIGRWAEPHRRYHDVVHLAAVLDGVDALAAHATDADAVRLAAWYHDAVYEGAPDDEENSARLAEAELRALGLSGPLIAETARLVRLTKSHDPVPGDRNGEVLCDADLAVLAAGADAYARYVDAVRAEYAHVPDQDFRAGRARILIQLLALPSLFRTPAGRERWEAPARANVEAELRALTP